MSAVVCGTFEDCSPPDDVRRLLTLRLSELGVPIAWGAPVGHGPRNHAIPLGAPATLDIAARSADLVVVSGRSQGGELPAEIGAGGSVPTG